ncbi:hemocyte protein-glutamine gamma-glutamyltransferase-like [Dermacentor andersoni]|uniref:hemocyte protein-glutamine gamma-glutamyltransferase-like n=1 Tax=Dermacentor andersoni TaxID=34620 RepID=UPI0021554F73|nr:hemocyte protein-glutamine gamma-glutamyltransferase-like [Dermacentor andersoni]
MPRVPRHLAAAFAGPFLLLWWSLAEVSAQGGSGINVDLFFEENAVVHHTEPFKILRGHAPSLVLRRGFAFKLGVTAPASNVAIVLSLGDDPQPGDGSLVQLPVPENPQSVTTHPAAGQDQWTLVLEHQEGPMRLVRIQIPVTVGVGRWILTITGDGHNFRVRESLYILFNPWHNGDLVYMEQDQARAFYVMQDRGLVYHGHVEHPHPKEWYYGQFEKATLPTAEFLLKIRELPISERGNPIAVSRALASGVNSKDNNGVVQGKWSPPYSNGVHPYAWSSSSAIINQYMELGGNTVLYGQCFTFAGVLNTLLRAMGMPSRVVTNFPSVHTDNGGQVLDIRFTNQGAKPYMAGSIWNYHVWNEGWMTRPDLPGGYDGWQVLDGTPQGLSMHSQLFEVGPFPVRGVFDDKIDMPFDGNVARAAVKATYRYFIADMSNPSGWRLVKVQENECGKLIATEAIGTGMLEDITHNYKRRPMPMARHSVEELVTVKLRHEKSLPLGQPIAVTCVVSNHLEKRFYAHLTIIATSVTYNNRFPRTIFTKVYNITMSAGGEQMFHVIAQPQDYIMKLRGECMISIEATLKYSNDLAYARSVATIQLPKLKVDLTPVGRNGEVYYNVSMKNPLAIPLTSCELAVELPGSTKFLTPTPAGSVEPFGVFFKSGSIVRTSVYTREFNAAFHCREMPMMNGYRILQASS